MGSPVNPMIPLMYQPPQVNNPVQTATGIQNLADLMQRPAILQAQLQGEQLKNQERSVQIQQAQRQLAYAATLNQAIQQNQVAMGTVGASGPSQQTSDQPTTTAATSGPSQTQPIASGSSSDAGNDQVGDNEPAGAVGGGPSDAPSSSDISDDTGDGAPIATLMNGEAARATAPGLPISTTRPAVNALASGAAVPETPLSHVVQPQHASPVIPAGTIIPQGTTSAPTSTGWDGVANELRKQGFGLEAAGLQQQINAMSEKNAELLSKSLANQKTRIQMMGASLNGVDENSNWETVRQRLIQDGADPRQIPLQYSPQWIKETQARSLDVAAFADETRKASDDATKSIGTVANYFGSVTDPARFIQARQTLLQLGYQPAIVRDLGDRWVQKYNDTRNGQAAADEVRKAALTAPEAQAAPEKAATATAKQLQVGAQILGGATGASDYAAKRNKLDPAIRDAFPETYSPDNLAAVQKVGTEPSQQSQRDMQAARDAETAQHHRTMEGIEGEKANKTAGATFSVTDTTGLVHIAQNPKQLAALKAALKAANLLPPGQ